MLKTAPAEHQGKKSGLSISFSEAGRFLGRLTDLVSLIKNFFFLSSSISRSLSHTGKCGLWTQGDQNPKTWRVNSPPLKGEEIQSGEDMGRDFPTLENWPQDLLNLLEGRRMTPLTSKWTLHAPHHPLTYVPTNTGQLSATEALLPSAHKQKQSHYNVWVSFFNEKV